jgi:hypothetical protein
MYVALRACDTAICGRYCCLMLNLHRPPRLGCTVVTVFGEHKMEGTSCGLTRVPEESAPKRSFSVWEDNLRGLVLRFEKLRFF